MPSQLESISFDWQSSTNLSNAGFQFLPINYQALILSEFNTTSLFTCTRTCHSTSRCRIFDFDGQSKWCRLFEGNIITMGSIIASSSILSRVGSIKLHYEQFLSRGQSCSSCQGSRYMRCMNDTCECEVHTYFDGLICQSQKLLGGSCNNNTECRVDLNYTCLSRQQCGLASIQAASNAAGNANGTAGSSLSTLNFPSGITLGIDNALYVSDYSNHRVIKFPEGSSMGSVVAGTGIAGASVNQLNGPTGVYVDTSFNIYVADSNNFRIMFWQKNSSMGVKVAGTGVSGNTLSNFNIVAGLFVDSQKNIYVCDSGNHRILKFLPNITQGVLIGGSGVAGSGNNQLNTPYGIYYDELSSYVYVADYNNHRIQFFQVGVSTNGTTVAGGYGAGSGSQQLNLPYSVCVSKITNAIYIIESGNNRLQRWNSGATSGVTIGGNGASSGNYSTLLQGPMDIKLNINETYVYVSEMTKNRVWRFTLV